VSDFEPRQIVIAHESVWEGLERWAGIHSLELIPLGYQPQDDLPCYIFAPIARDKP
jgi:hypothetical protein